MSHYSTTHTTPEFTMEMSYEKGKIIEDSAALNNLMEAITAAHAGSECQQIEFRSLPSGAWRFEVDFGDARKFETDHVFDELDYLLEKGEIEGLRRSEVEKYQLVRDRLVAIHRQFTLADFAIEWT